MAKKLGLCLGSGGTRGIAHVGFLQALVENNIPIDMISGCSMGSLVGALFERLYALRNARRRHIAQKKRHF
jgi:predicted acylesterase/phospholipase RssA